MGPAGRTHLIGPVVLLSSVLASSPAAAQVDLSGQWAARAYEDQPERVPGPEIANYLGLPINDAARLRADSWESSVTTLPEWQCRPYQADYILLAPFSLTITKEEDPLTRDIRAYHAEFQRTIDNPIYLDGRPHPDKNGPSSWGGFATGKWDGDVLTVTITNLKEGTLLRNGVPRSSEATITEHWIRHGDFLTVAAITTDPVYLTEPLIRTLDFELDPHQRLAPYPCEMVTEIERPNGVVPQYLPDTNPDLEEFGTRHGIPFEATRGGAATTYPDYRKRLKELMGPFPTGKRWP